MKKYLIILAAVAVAIVFPANAQQEISIYNLQNHIVELSSDKYEGRGTGEKGGKKAAKYIVSQFKKMKVKPKGVNKYYQEFEFDLKLMDPANPHGEPVNKGKIKGLNVIGYVDNAAEYTVVIGAHYDHLGLGELGGSREGNPAGVIHNGADDNASGVAGVLELARYLQNNGKIEENNYLFILFSGEEEGLYGSKFFTNNATVELEKINYMINMDMIGRLDSSSRALVVHGVGTNPGFGRHLSYANRYGFSIRYDSAGIGASDFTSFYLKNIPVLGFFTGQHNDYHKGSDDADKINYAGEKDVLEYIKTMIERLDTAGKLAFQKTKEPEMGRSRFKVSLGVMPDYTYSGTGLRIDGVTTGKAAEAAGLKGGDVIVKIGDTDITDIGAYMQALGTLEPNTNTTVTVRRGEELLTLPVEFK